MPWILAGVPLGHPRSPPAPHGCANAWHSDNGALRTHSRTGHRPPVGAASGSGGTKKQMSTLVVLKESDVLILGTDSQCIKPDGSSIGGNMKKIVEIAEQTFLAASGWLF